MGILSLAAAGAAGQAGSIGIQTEPEPLNWAKPSSGAPIRVIVIAPRFTLTDAATFADHVECDLTLAPLWSRTELGGPIHHGAAIPNSSENDTLDALHDKLSKKYDLIVAANFEFRILPDSVVSALADHVGAGTGLLLANVDPTVDARWANGMTPLADADAIAFVTRGIAEQETPAWRNGLDFVYLATMGRGHIAWLDYPGGVPATQSLQPLSAHTGFDSDYSTSYFSLLARCAHWAANIRPELHITGIEEEDKPAPDPEEVPVGLIIEEYEAALAAMKEERVKRFDVQLSEPAAKSYTVQTRTRRPGDPGDPLAVSVHPDHVERGDKTFPVYVFAGTGVYLLDVWLLDDSGVVDWFTRAVEVNQWPRIQAMDFDPNEIGPATSLTIDGIVELNPYQRRTCVTRARAYDAAGRRLAESHSEVTPGTDRFRHVLELEDVEGALVRIEVAALDGIDMIKLPTPWEFNVAATYRAVLPVTGGASTRRYRMLSNWNVADQSVSPAAFRALRTLGLDGVYLPAGGTAIYDAAAAGLRPMVGARMIRGLGESGANQEPLFFNPRIEPLLDIVRNAAPLGAGPFLLQQSAAPLADATENPTFVQAYQGAVQRDYHNIETLNAVWRTGYADWRDLPRPTRNDVQRTKNLEPWMRYQAAVDETRSANWDIMASLMGQAVEGASVGFDFSEPFPHESIDWRSARAAMALPDRLTVERIRSYAGDDADKVLVWPEILLESDSTFAPWLPWYGLLHSFDAGVWPEPVGKADTVPSTLLLGSDGAPRTQLPRAMAEALRIKESGLGALLLASERDATGIAIYDSRASGHVNNVDASFATQSEDAVVAAIALLEALGFQYDLIAPGAVLDGGLTAYRVLLLPMVRALSEDEVRELRAFHRDGGCLVADVAPGQYDEHGIPRDVLPFDDLFGVRHPRPVQAAGPSDTVVELPIGGQRVSAELTGLYTDASVEAMDTTVGGMADHVPTWIVNESDERCAVLMNHAMPPYRDPDGAMERAMRVLMESLLTRWASPPPVDVTVASGFFGETVYWRYGNANIVTLLANPLQEQSAAKVRVHAEKGHRIYNRLAEKPRTAKGNINVELAPGDAAAITVLPYEVKGLEIETAIAVVPGERLPFQIELDTGKATASRHLIRVELIPPLSSPFAKRITHVTTTNGAATGRIRLALNDRFGTYTLRATDLLTGVSNEQTLQVGPEDTANQPFTINR